MPVAEGGVVQELVALLEGGGGKAAEERLFDEVVGVGCLSVDGPDEVVDRGNDVRREGPHYV